MSTEPTRQLFPIYQASFHSFRQPPPFLSGTILPGRPTPNKKERSGFPERSQTPAG